MKFPCVDLATRLREFLAADGFALDDPPNAGGRLQDWNPEGGDPLRIYLRLNDRPCGTVDVCRGEDGRFVAVDSGPLRVGRGTAALLFRTGCFFSDATR